VFIDAAAYGDDIKNLSSGTELRAIRVAVDGTYGDLWDFKVEADFADSKLTLKDAFIAYGGFSRAGLRIGQFKEPISLEALTSSRHITFMERGLPNALLPSRHLGALGSVQGETWLLQGGLFGQSASDVGSSDLSGSEGWAATARATIAPLMEEDRLVHLGGSISRRTPDASSGTAQEVSFKARPETHVDRTAWLDTGDIEDVDNTVLMGLEAVGVFGPASVQGEYMRTSINGLDSTDDAVVDGAYVLVTWFPMGGSRAYRSSSRKMDEIKPSDDGGTLELAARFSTLDLNGEDGEIGGGSADQITLGANWYFTPKVRLMANLIFVDNDEFATGDGDFAGNDDLTAFQMRFQINW
jgi:phosphate-selective porin OprO/OprP